MSENEFEIDGSWIDGEDVIEARLATVEETAKESVGQVLRYLFVSGSPGSLPKAVKTQAEGHLSAVERFVLQWLFKRTDGKLRRHYGSGVLDAIKKARYQCESCGFRDVRALNLEKVESEDDANPSFVCLCANCNTVAARAKEMETVATAKEVAALAAAAKAEAEAAEAEAAKAETEATASPAESDSAESTSPANDG